MAVVDKNTNEWVNDDGLLIKFGTDKARVERGGEYSVLQAGIHVVSFMLDLASLPTVASTNEQIQLDNVTIPNGAFITKVRVTVVEEPTDASGTANLDMGLVDQDRTTEIDFNGFLAAADLFNAGTDLGTIVEYDTLTTEAGALVGTQITNTGLITASAETADFTDGTLKVDIEYFMPHSTDL